MITEKRIQELIKLVEDWHYQSSDGDILLELVEIVKQQQVSITALERDLAHYKDAASRFEVACNEQSERHERERGLLAIGILMERKDK